MKNFKFYNIVISNNDQLYTLTYELNDHKPAQVWANIMSEMTIDKLRIGKDPWQGKLIDISILVNELLSLIHELNEWMPKKIMLTWDYSDIQDSVNKFHIHFPEHQDDKDILHRKQLTRYNDLIHDIENTYRIQLQNKEYLHLLVCPDPTTYIKVPIEDQDYQYFQIGHNFGDLLLGYGHIGRHPYEICNSNDVSVPPDQILCQNLISTIHYLQFNEVDVVSNEQIMHDESKFKNFYYSSGIKWPYALDDPKLAVGYIPMGKLKYVDGTELSKDEIYSIVRSCNKIVNWYVG
jgi:hypothetical protein